MFYMQGLTERKLNLFVFILTKMFMTNTKYVCNRGGNRTRALGFTRGLVSPDYKNKHPTALSEDVNCATVSLVYIILIDNLRNSI